MQKSPLLVLALGTLGLVVGYGAVILRGPLALANGVSCPSKQYELCTKGGCDAQKCASGECSTDCPACNRHG